MKKLISIVLCAAMLLTAAVFPASGANDYTPENGSFIFDSEESLDVLSHANDLTPTYDSDVGALKLTASGRLYDPRVLLDFENTVSADSYKYLLFTYMMPATVSSSPNVGGVSMNTRS